ncbi:MAG: hypothetical protein CMJ74_06010 [Planctomycetaceae bacterium]|nr:hypothetical protein [Planctomycetaceae bacterium]
MHSESLDVYRDWLGIKEAERPLDYYQLLRLSRFEDDQDRVRRHYRKMHNHARKFATGEFSNVSQELLNELARAMLCLTDLERKKEYDISLGRKSDGTRKQQGGLAEILLQKKLLTREQLEVADSYASAVGLSLRDAVCQKNFLSQLAVMQAFAQAEGLPFIELTDFTIDESLLPRISAVIARTHSVVPLMIERDQLLLASPNPLDLHLEEDLKLRLGIPVRTVLCTSSDANRIIQRYYPREKADAEILERSQSDPSAEKKDETEEAKGLVKTWERIKSWAQKKH